MNFFNLQTTIYKKEDSCVFKKNNEEFGALSNMSYFPLVINNYKLNTAEALYQACKFPLIQKFNRE